jgi:uncharacterized OB-fold protein
MTHDQNAYEFWRACANGQLRYQVCDSCKGPQFYPRPFCAKCGSDKLDWATSKGSGTVYAVTTVERAPTEDFRALQPYAIALVDLDEGFRMMAHADTAAKIGDRVQVTFLQHGERHLPHFARA